MLSKLLVDQDKEESVIHHVLIAQCILEFHLIEDNVLDVYKVKLYHQWVFAVNALKDHGLLTEELAEDKLSQAVINHVEVAIACNHNVEDAAAKDVAEEFHQLQFQNNQIA